MSCPWRISCLPTCSSTTTKAALFPAGSLPVLPRSRRPGFGWTPQASSALRASSQPTVSEIEEEDVLKMFLRERELNGDFISKACDMLSWKSGRNFADDEARRFDDTAREREQVMEEDSDDGFLKLTRTQDWLMGGNPAPVNKAAIAKALQDDRDRMKQLNFLKYEAIKKELMLLSVGIGTACTGYCLVVLGVQAAISYAIGASFSCLYLQLLYQHVDNFSEEMVPQIFMKKRAKKIGIRTEDLQDALEKWIKGSGIALASPRLVIPAIVYGLWALSHHYLPDEIFDFQIAPAMVGMFVYKAACLVQVYRDNEDLRLIFPEEDERSSV